MIQTFFLFALICSSISAQDTTFDLASTQASKCLWPANNRFALFENLTTNYFNLLDLPSNCTVDELNVTCINSQPDGDEDCFYNIENDTLCVRAERGADNKRDRVYNVTVEATVTCGNSTDNITYTTNATWRVIVPRDGRRSCKRKNKGDDDKKGDDDDRKGDNDDRKGYDRYRRRSVSDVQKDDDDRNSKRAPKRAPKPAPKPAPKRKHKPKPRKNYDIDDSPDNITFVNDSSVCAQNPPTNAEELCNETALENIVDCFVQAGSNSNVADVSGNYTSGSCVALVTISPALTLEEASNFLSAAQDAGCIPSDVSVTLDILVSQKRAMDSGLYKVTITDINSSGSGLFVGLAFVLASVLLSSL